MLPPAQRAAEARKNARRALQLAPDHVRATAVLALAEQLAGDLPEARKIVVAGLRAHPSSEVLKAVLHRLNRPQP
jgi:Tfp pilus assembly protein PilF